MLGAGADGQELTLEISADADAALAVQVWVLREEADGAQPQGGVEALVRSDARGRAVYTLPLADAARWDRLGLVITHAGGEESPDSAGSYTLVLRPGTGEDRG